MYGHGPEVQARIDEWKRSLADELAAMEACLHPSVALTGPGHGRTCQDCGRYWS